MSANFTPDMTGYKGLSPFRFWCQKTLPLVYDDSLSYYELLCKVVNYINNLITDVSAAEENVDKLLTAYNQLQEYVNNYFDGADFQQKIDDSLDRYAEDGTLSRMVNTHVAALLPYEVGQQIGPVVDEDLGPVVDLKLPAVVESKIAAPVATQLPAVVQTQIGGVVGNQIGDVVADQIDEVVADQITDAVSPLVHDEVTGLIRPAVATELPAALQVYLPPEVQTQLPGAIGTDLETIAPPVIEDWLDAHPEATTSVPDGSISFSKLATDLQRRAGIVGTYFPSDFTNEFAWQVNQYAVYQGIVYRCIKTTTVGQAWNASEWTTANMNSDLFYMWWCLNYLSQSITTIDSSPATSAHEAGEYFIYYDGVHLYRLAKASSNIAVGDTLTPNGNFIYSSVANMIADLKVEIADLKSAIDEITETSGYQYVQVPNVTKYPDERWYYPAGTGPTASGGTGKTAIEFACSPLTDYDICGKYAGTSDGYPIFVMDASYTILDTITTAEQVTVDGEARHTLFTTPANAAIIRYNVATDAAYDSQRGKVAVIAPKGVPGLEQDVSALDERCDNLDDDIAEIKDTVDDITENEILGYAQIANVTKYADQRWYLNGTGPTSSGATGKTALEFACQPNTAYAICGKYAGTSEGYPIISMDASNNVLDTITDAEQVEYQGVNRFTFFTTPANAAKVRYNVATDASFDQQLEAVYYLAPKGFSMLTPNILAGKKWAALGDSFTAYTDKTFDAGVYKTKDRVYSRIIAERNRMTLLERFFASGRTLAYPSDGTFTNSVTCPSAACYYQNIPDDVDYITIMLGINDEHHYTGGGDGEDPTGVITLGTIDDNTTATYYGAWNVVLSWLIANRPNAHIGIIVTNGLSIPEWRQAQINIAQKYGVAYIDLNGDQITPVMLRTVNSNIADSVKAALISKWAVDPTGAGGTVNTHPNWQAHEYEAAFIEDFLRRI